MRLMVASSVLLVVNETDAGVCATEKQPGVDDDVKVEHDGCVLKLRCQEVCGVLVN